MTYQETKMQKEAIQAMTDDELYALALEKRTTGRQKGNATARAKIAQEELAKRKGVITRDPMTRRNGSTKRYVNLSDKYGWGRSHDE